ncbi:DUF4870 domain-containing protein [Rhizobium sp. CECT 9324]|jgi:uncharacterized membrane protein|uniref:DUF4870 family protein n=1 Tax=Rhizobium sp. CECT 9324 TaxID=2845820 RepID=UPI000DE13D25|nr:DUF4870 domain-containing protein [Rhizobium sp. CECT 9324]CAH0339654.1 hypothetical protein RHI9324_01305 [Rhizobium sp. CECT 9324]
MTDPNSQVPTPSSTESWFTPGRLNAQLVYGLYLVSFVVGISGIIGLVIAYMNRGKGAAWVDTHYTWAIRTFWIGLLYALVSSILAIFFFGLILLFATAIWIVVRCVIGLQKVSANQPIERPDSWWV